MGHATTHDGFRQIKRHDGIFKERVHDAYKAKGKLLEPTVCLQCGAVFHEGRWQWREAPANAHRSTCPACHRIHDHFPAGFLTLKGEFFQSHRDEIMHLVRNAMDHGIEPREARLAKGKSVKARVTLNAYHDSGSIVIEVSDDGGGLNREKILNKARERGLIGESQHLTDADAYRLIFEAGFSTADQVSNLSGRGVGMDVVKRNIEALRGTIELASHESLGTTVRIRLPLTLAIIDGFLVGVGRNRYVIPLDMVLECVELPEAERQACTDEGHVNLRGQVLPYLRVRTLFDLQGQTGSRENIVVVQYGGHKIGLVVDTLLGEFQTVIKPLGTLFSRLKGFSGFTILGTGEVALILDVPSLIRTVTNREVQAGTHALPAATAHANVDTEAA